MWLTFFFRKTFIGSEEFERKKNRIFINNNYMTECFCEKRLKLAFARLLPVFWVFSSTGKPFDK